MAIVFGTNKNDFLKGTNKNDFLDGEEGNDILIGGKGDDFLNGESGNDLHHGGSGNDIIDGEGGNDILLGGNGNDFLEGEDGNDILKGGNGSDTLIGEDGNDRLTGGKGSDDFYFTSGEVFNPSEIGFDTITDFGNGRDNIVLAQSTFTALTPQNGGTIAESEFEVVETDADAQTSTAFITYSTASGKLFYNPDGATPGFGGGGEFAQLQGIPTLKASDIKVDDKNVIFGTDDDDVLEGTNKNDFLDGEEGDDTLIGNNGDDFLNGEDGNDFHDGGNGNDTIDGDVGKDTIIGGNGNDFLDGEDGNDILEGGKGRDTLIGEDGDDTLTGGKGSDDFYFIASEVFNSSEIGFDTITDFGNGRDNIVLLQSTFTALTPQNGGTIAESEFEVVETDADAQTSTAFITYSTASGKLFYNPDGATPGFGSGGEFAELQGIPTLNASDIKVD